MDKLSVPIFVSILFCLMIIFESVETANKKQTKLKTKKIQEEDKIDPLEFYGRGFYNHSGCLYVHMDGGEFEMTTMEGDLIEEDLNITSLSFDEEKTYCTNEAGMARLMFTYELSGVNKIKSITIVMKVHSDSHDGYWRISQSNLTVSRGGNKKKTFPLKIQNEAKYVTDGFSYSCNELELETHHRKQDLDDNNQNETSKLQPHGRIILNRFQLQPYPESEQFVFSQSFDCSTWFTIPTLIGLILILFMLLLGIGPVYWLVSIEPGDFKFTKEAQLFTQSQMESTKKN